MQAIIVFDFGGVLFDWNPDYLYQKLIPDPSERAWFLQHVCNGTWNIEQDRGRSLTDGTAAKIAEFPEYAELIEAFYARWTEMLPGLLPEGMALFEALESAGYPIFGLTNWSNETFPYAWEHYPFLQRITDIVVSGQEQIIKPDPAIYHLMYQRILQHHPAAKPEDLIFIDDSAINAQGACNVGWYGIHHTSAAATAQQLRDKGLKF
ncbi:HAD family phosphatase [Chitinibacter bivalviorum]|uniref:HAD family phosphatase n=1 Tax=Chitinibacter bivalviorum TaxID=2739434 RepID=A0A7H9BFT1_9NEIS|nr:HAD family phosphatase [Chitinibacter bivalviorum]QLG87058.1 HAD family phosphatase [Chitinibacter bivalviorum]